VSFTLLSFSVLEMKRTHEESPSPNWNNRLVASWQGSHLPPDTWKIIYDLIGDDLRSILAIERVNLALYTAFGGFEKIIDFALARGRDDLIDRARRVSLDGETLLHSLKWTVLTHGEYDDSRSLFQQLALEMDRLEPNIRTRLASLDLANIPALVFAGGFVRVLMLCFLRRVGIKTPAGISEYYSDIDIWISLEIHDDQSRRPDELIASLVESEDEQPSSSNSVPVMTIQKNRWSKSPIQCISLGLHTNGSMLTFQQQLLYYFDFTCCQVAVTFREWDIGQVTLTPAFLYSLMTGSMFEGHPWRELPYPFRTCTEDMAISMKDQARLLLRFFKCMGLGYRDPTLSQYDVAHMERIFNSTNVQSALRSMRDDTTDYLFLQRLYG
jgi:hypothetical protein